jgi:hypothetical protein
MDNNKKFIIIGIIIICILIICSSFIGFFIYNSQRSSSSTQIPTLDKTSGKPNIIQNGKLVYISYGTQYNFPIGTVNALYVPGPGQCVATITLNGKITTLKGDRITVEQDINSITSIYIDQIKSPPDTLDTTSGKPNFIQNGHLKYLTYGQQYNFPAGTVSGLYARDTNLTGSITSLTETGATNNSSLNPKQGDVIGISLNGANITAIFLTTKQ